MPLRSATRYEEGGVRCTGSVMPGLRPNSCGGSGSGFARGGVTVSGGPGATGTGEVWRERRWVLCGERCGERRVESFEPEPSGIALRDEELTMGTDDWRPSARLLCSRLPCSRLLCL
jgi:hypothetical protein